MNFRVYRSSAGSGKTFTLVMEYLTLVLRNPKQYRNILAVTFTNKAANEMKERILRRLKEIAAGTGDAILLPKLITLTGLNEKELEANAAEVLSFILHRYSDFAVCTIDSFTHRIIRSFAHDLHLPQNFEVEMHPEKFIAEAVDLLISKAGIDAALTRALVEFTESRALEEKNWNVENDLISFARTLLDEDTQEYIGRLNHLRVGDFIKIRSKIAALRQSFEKEISEKGKSALDIIGNAGLKAEYFHRGKTGIVKYFEYLRDGRTDKFNPSSFVIETVEEGKWYGSKSGSREKAAIDSIRDELLRIYRDARLVMENGLGDYVVYSEISRNIFPLAVLNEMSLLISELKSENNIVFISEFNQRISEVVLHEPVPFIYERAGERYQHFLLDEFQDTSVMQWQNLIPLIDNSLAGGNFNMVVGDGKQAIYRWRNGDVEQFQRLPEILKKQGVMAGEFENSLKRNFEMMMLDTNFRSLKHIIEFNNGLFSFIHEHLGGSAREIYAHVKQKALDTKPGGFVEIHFIDEPEDGEISFEELQFGAVETAISTALEDNYSYRDITVICRSNFNAGNTARYLISKDIPVISSESLLLSASPDIHFMVSLLRWFANTRDDLAKASVLSWLARNHKNDSVTLESMLHQLREGTGFNALLRSLGFDLPFGRLVREPVYELCEELMRIFGLSAKADPYLAFFLDAVFEYSGRNNSSTAGFISWWDEHGNGLSVKVPEGTDAVQVMTIHRSKGLEFPVVIYAFATEQTRNTKTTAWVELGDARLSELPVAMIPLTSRLEPTRFAPLITEEKERSFLDYINLLYVVLTRPVERLHVLTGMPSADTAGLTTVADVMSAYLGSLGIWNDGQHIYSFGERLASAYRAGHRETPAFPGFASAGWKGRAALRLRAGDVPYHDDEKKNYGLLVHRILSEINTFQDIQPALARVFADGLLNKEGCEELKAYLDRLAARDEIAVFFNNDAVVRSEAEIIDAEGKSHRPDRVLLYNNRTVVIDFKTGARITSHDKQLTDYASLLAAMNYPGIEKYLIYLHEEPLLVKVD